MYRESPFIVDARYVWYNQGTMIVLMYFLNNVPFSFDEVFRLEAHKYMDPLDMECMNLADKESRYNPEDVFKGASYLIAEQAHPCFHDIEIQNIEILPDDICGIERDLN